MFREPAIISSSQASRLRRSLWMICKVEVRKPKKNEHLKEPFESSARYNDLRT